MCPKENSIKRTYLSQSMETKIRPTNSWTEHALFWDVSSETLIAKVRLRSNEEQKLLTSHQYRPWWTGNRIHSHIVCMLSASADGPLLQISGAERGHSDTMPAFVLTKAVPSKGSDSDIVLAGNLHKCADGWEKTDTIGLLDISHRLELFCCSELLWMEYDTLGLCCEVKYSYWDIPY